MTPAPMDNFDRVMIALLLLFVAVGAMCGIVKADSAEKRIDKIEAEQRCRDLTGRVPR